MKKIDVEDFNGQAREVFENEVLPQIKKAKLLKLKLKKSKKIIMGKIIIEFDSIEESQDARVALDAMRWKMSIWDLDQKLRTTTKYGQKFWTNAPATPEEIDTCDQLRQEIRTILGEYGLNLND